MTNDLMDAILAVNAYNFGPGATLTNLGSQIGTWTYKLDVVNPSANFVGVEYQQGDNFTISYRGTTDVLGTSFFDGDMWNGYGVGGGSVAGNDAALAMDFYTDVLNDAGGAADKITLTGHSLGGGLAGLIADITISKAVVFDNMPYEAAATAARNLADQTNQDYNPYIASTFYNGSAPIQNSDAHVSGYYTIGELLAPLRATQTKALAGLDPHAGSWDPSTWGSLTPVDLHSQALAVMLLYAQQNGWTNWAPIAQAFIPQLWNDQLADASGVGQYKTSGASSSDALRQMIAYSAIDEGTLLFGNTAIKSLFDDATNLGTLVPSNLDDLSSTNDMVYRDLSQIAIQYAGHLAAEKSTDASLASGVVSSAQNVVTIDLNPATWQAQTALAAPQIVGKSDLVEDVIISTVGTPAPEDTATAFQNLFKSSGASLINGITEVKAASSGGMTLNASDAPNAFGGSAGGAVLIGSPNGNTTFVGGGGTNIMLGQASDTFDLAVGNNIILEQNAGTATLDASTATSPSTSTNWNMVESDAGAAETFLFQSANLAPLTIVYGAGGSDTFDFEAGANDNIGVYILQMNDINQANFLSLDPSKLNAYITQNFGSSGDDGYGGGFDDKIILINPTATDILKYNGQVISDPTRYLQYTDSAVGGMSTNNPNLQGGSYGMGERSVDPNDNLHLLGDANTPGGVEAYYTDAWESYTNASNNYGLKSGNVNVTRDYAYSNDYETLGPQNKLVLTGITADQSSFSYDRQNWNGTETDTETAYYDYNHGSLSLIGFNTGDFGIGFAHNGAGSDFQESDQTYAVSQWSQAHVDNFGSLPEITGIVPAGLGASLGTSSIPLADSQWNIVGDDAFTSDYNRPSLTASDFMRAA